MSQLRDLSSEGLMFVTLVCERELMSPSSVCRTDGSSEAKRFLPVVPLSSAALARGERVIGVLIAADETSTVAWSDAAMLCVMSGIMTFSSRV